MVSRHSHVQQGISYLFSIYFLGPQSGLGYLYGPHPLTRKESHYILKVINIIRDGVWISDLN